VSESNKYYIILFVKRNKIIKTFLSGRNFCFLANFPLKIKVIKIKTIIIIIIRKIMLEYLD